MNALQKTPKELQDLGIIEALDPADVDDDATDADKKAADKNMIMQMRKAMDVKGNMKIEFGDGKKEKVDPKILQMMVTAHGKIEKPRDKEKFVAMISKSKRDMLNVAKKLSTLKMGLDKEDEPIVKKVVQMLKKASKAHAGQASDLDKAIKETLDIKEGTWKMPDNPKEVAALKKLMSRPLPIGNTEDEKMYKDSASSKLYSLLGDDELFDALGALEDKGKEKADARPVIIKWFQKRVKDNSYDLGDETKALGKAIGLKMEYVPEAYKPVKANHYDVKIQGVKKKDVNAILKYIKVDGGNYDIEDVDADQVTGGGMSSTSDGDIFIQGDDAGKLGMEIAKKFRGVKVMGEGIELDENYRKLAMMGIGTETKKAAKVGLKTDYYLPKNGDKSFGKITRVTSSGYEITDEKTKKVHKFKFYDPNNDPTSVRGTREEVELDEVTMSKALNIDPKDADRMKTLAVLYTRAMKLPAGSPKQDKFKKEIEKLRKELGMNESTFKELVKSVELDEKYDLYHKTFSDAMQHAYDYAKKKLGITVDPKEIDNKVATGPRKPSEGRTNKYRLKGKGGNLQIQVYNKGGSKPFELNMYKEENEMSDKLTDGNISLKETVLKVWQEAAKDKDEGFASDAQRKAAFASGYKEKGKKKDKEEGNEFSGALDKARKAGKKTFKVGGKEYPVEPAKKESVERYHETKQGSLRDAVLQMWGEGVKEDKKTLTKEKKNGIKKMTDTGKEVTPVETSVKMPKIKETNNKV